MNPADFFVMMFLFGVGLCVAFVIVWRVYKSKGCKFRLWLHLPIVLLLLFIADLFAGYLGDFIALVSYVVIALLRVASVSPPLAVPPQIEALKKCSFCAETIKAEAVKCRFCNSELPTVTRPDVPPVLPPESLKEYFCGYCQRKVNLLPSQIDSRTKCPACGEIFRPLAAV